MTLNFMVNFWCTVDENGSITWTVSNDEISILYYFNDENIDLQKILSLLNEFVEAICRCPVQKLGITTIISL